MVYPAIIGYNNHGTGHNMETVNKINNLTMEFRFHPPKAYALKRNAEKAVRDHGFDDLRHFYTYTKDGRIFPVFVGQEAAQRGVHFHFMCVG